MSALGRTVTDSPLARRNPTVKLALLTVVSVVVLFVLDPLTPGVLYGLALVGVVVGTRAAPRTLALAHVPFVAFAVGVLLVNALSRPGTVLWTAGPLRVTQEGVEIGTALAARTLLIGVLAVGFLLSTDGVALMTSLRSNARLSPRVTYAALAGYRMLQEMPREWATLQHAHAVRAPLRDDGRAVLGVRHHAGVVFGLLVVSLRKGERMSQALESRGLGRTPHTTWRPVAVDRRDAGLVVGVLAVLALVLALSAVLDILEGPGALTR
ncbi:energy-coupling factor transporter transmembrane component T [Cellulomonas sp. ATA003]|uniref:energy-coupling factor transporter transmembrane component T family protein n=1 Tax=Cellulomonas sp. ATA003 TaxID=3073064 RepID=UPI0028733C5B|nr:energy-coupling factor transporter transmembrane component T [Cellulomonas sp. ATA003]WNB86567.1 energy-coupling factor transporter transmembrane component T [Cellulomonas sp. ATA003]